MCIGLDFNPAVHACISYVDFQAHWTNNWKVYILLIKLVLENFFVPLFFRQRESARMQAVLKDPSFMKDPFEAIHKQLLETQPPVQEENKSASKGKKKEKKKKAKKAKSSSQDMEIWLLEFLNLIKEPF